MTITTTNALMMTYATTSRPYLALIALSKAKIAFIAVLANYKSKLDTHTSATPHLHQHEDG